MKTSQSVLFLLLSCGAASGQTGYWFRAPNDWPSNDAYETHITTSLVGSVLVGGDNRPITVFLDPGGSITGNVSNIEDGFFIVNGGTLVGNLTTGMSSRIEIRSGEINGSIVTLGDSGWALIRGGSISGPIIQHDSPHDISIFGRNFKLDGVPIAPGEYVRSAWTDGILQCILEDGTPMNALVSMPKPDHLPLDWGQIRLVLVPEPSSLMSAALGTWAVLLTEYRSKKKRPGLFSRPGPLRS